MDRPAPVLVDLAAALIVRAERAQAPRDLLEAYVVAQNAVQLDPRNPTALYNAAFALDRFGLVDEAVRGWRTYLVADSASEWADDARRRIENLSRISSPSRMPAEDEPLPAYSAYASSNPQGARELAMNRLLANWGRAVAAGEADRAEDMLNRAAVIGDALVRRRSGDGSVADAVRAIRSAQRNAAALRSLARAHRAYAAAMVHYDSSKYAQAEPPLMAAAAASAASPVLRQWAETFRGTVRVHNRAAREGEHILREVVTAIDADRHPALAARARWSLGNTLGRADQWERGLEHARESARLFALSGERENEGAALNVVTYAHFVLGEPDSGYAVMHRALDRLRPYRTSIRLRTLFTAGSPLVEGDGLFSAALCLQNEGVAVATRNGAAVQIVEARAARARLLATYGHAQRARADVLTARKLAPGVRDTVVRQWLQADLREVEALTSLRTDPERATAAMDSAAAFFAGIPIRAFPYLVGGAEARLFARDPGGAIARLDRAIGMLDQRRDSIRIEPRRAAVFDAARTVIDRIVMLMLADGRAAEALDYMDRGRASLAPAGFASAQTRMLSAPAGEVAVEYALVADTLLAWTVSEIRIEVFRAAVDTMRLIQTIEEVEAQLQRHAPVAEVHPALAVLYDWLLRPLEGRLGRSGTPLVIIADGALAAVPFAALYDTRLRRYMIEDRPVRYAVSLREAWRVPTAEHAPGILLIADPAFDTREHPLLDRLPHAADEVRGFTTRYPDAVVLRSDGATRNAVTSALPRAAVTHFVGHAVFDDERPERSYIVLASEPHAPGRITAEELARMDLRRVQLVVLAACRTVRSGRRRAAGFTGLSGALLAAGAGGTVGSTWDVDDRHTATLMAAFHHQYQRHADGPAALREAQLALLRSPIPVLRSPAAWAGFRYTGR